MAVCHLMLLLKAPAGPRSWSRAHGPGPTVPVPRSQAHGPGPTVPGPRSRSHGPKAHGPGPMPCPWSRLGMSKVQVGPVPGPGWARAWSRLGPSLVQVGPVPGPDWARVRGPFGAHFGGPIGLATWTRHIPWRAGCYMTRGRPRRPSAMSLK